MHGGAARTGGMPTGKAYSGSASDLAQAIRLVATKPDFIEHAAGNFAKAQRIIAKRTLWQELSKLQHNLNFPKPLTATAIRLLLEGIDVQ